jgi:hypothetical protein
LHFYFFVWQKNIPAFSQIFISAGENCTLSFSSGTFSLSSVTLSMDQVQLSVSSRTLSLERKLISFSPRAFALERVPASLSLSTLS